LIEAYDFPMENDASLFRDIKHIAPLIDLSINRSHAPFDTKKGAA